LGALFHGCHTGREVLGLNPNTDGSLYPVCDYLPSDIPKDCLFSDAKMDENEVKPQNNRHPLNLEEI
jgi:hypothetical protein